VKCRLEEGVVFKGVAFRELRVGRSRWRLPQSRHPGLQGSTHCGYCVHGSHLLPMDYDPPNISVPATATRSSVMSPTIPLRWLAIGSTHPDRPMFPSAGTVWRTGTLGKPASTLRGPNDEATPFTWSEYGSTIGRTMFAMKIDRNEFMAFARRHGYRRSDVLMLTQELP
jgi:hypothetical protein